MAATRLSDSQKEQIVARYRQGETGQALAEAFGCSPNTVSRVVKAALDPQELAALKRQRGRGATAAGGEAPAEPLPPVQTVLAVAAETPAPAPPVPAAIDPLPAPAELEADGPDDDGGAHLAIDDADDFGDDGLEEDEEAEFEAAVAPAGGGARAAGAPRSQASVLPLAAAALPARLYLLVDKTVELQAQPLADFPELGTLPEGEAERQALMLFTNPREAKRQCGRTQRVIPVPDPRLLERTAPYLVSQGITRLVLEGGGLYSLPGA